MTSLRENGLYENSLIVFTADVNNKKDENVYFNFFFSCLFTLQNGGQVIAGGNNYPLRGIKSTIWEGGTRAASFVHAPYILQRHGEISNK